MRHALQPRPPPAGFTLIELMIVVATVGVLALIAYPSFQDSVRKSRRADAVAGLNQLQQVQERYRGQSPTYANSVASMASMPGAISVSPQGHYVLTVDNASAVGYKMTATASATSPQYADTKCRGLRVEMAGGTITYSSLNAAGDVDTTNVNGCWQR